MDVLLFFVTTTFCVARADKTTSPLIQSLQDGTSLDANERICTVTENNEETLTGHLRSAVRLQNLWHRATYILVKHEPQDRHTSSGENPIVLVQRRSQRKDYGPGLLDPMPGGVVTFGETCEENAVREVQEEMGIDVSPGNAQGNLIRRQFTFSHQDDRVKVFGECYEVTYRGELSGLKLQVEEVDKVFPMRLSELRQRLVDSPDEFMTDTRHAFRLYCQRCVDRKVNRKLLKGYSSSNLDDYGLRPAPQVVFFDCDDTLYFDGWNTANQLTANIEEWCVQKVGLPPGKAYELYKQYGTALRGLLAEGHVEDHPDAIDKFLEEVHDLPIHQLLQPDPALRETLLQMDPKIPKYIFTASVSHHAERCLKALGIDDDIFEKVIIDVKQCQLETKHSIHSFRAAMKIAGVDDPEACIFLDDSVKNIQAARKIGWRSVLVGKVGRDCGKPISSDHAELEIDRIHDIAEVLPELFAQSSTAGQ